MPTPSMQHHAELDERAEVVARREQQPDRQRAGEESVDDDGDRERHAGEREHGRERGRLRHRTARRRCSASTSTKPMTEHSSTLPGRQ